MFEFKPEDEFRRTMSSLATTIKATFPVDRQTSISLGVGEAIDIIPQYKRYGLLLRLVNYERLTGAPDSTFCFAVRATGQVDTVDDSLRYIPLENLDPIERFERRMLAERTVQALSGMSLNHLLADSESRNRQDVAV